MVLFDPYQGKASMGAFDRSLGVKLEYKVAEIEDILKLFIKLTGVVCNCHYSKTSKPMDVKLGNFRRTGAFCVYIPEFKITFNITNIE